MAFNKYVLRHGSLSLGAGNPAVGVPLKPSADPSKPTLVEMSDEEAARINGPKEQQYLPGVKPKPPCLQLLAEYQAELDAEKAKAEVLAKVKPPPAEKAKGAKP